MDLTIILNTATPFDQTKVQAFDQVVNALYGLDSEHRDAADRLLNKFKSLPDAWACTDAIIEASANPNSKFLAFSILEDSINVISGLLSETRWKVLPELQRKNIKEYIWNKVVKIGRESALDPSLKHILSKLNSTLVAIVKQEWTSSWTTFVQDLCNISMSDQNLCENCLCILKLLSEEVFDFSQDSLTSAKASELKFTMTKEFASIFDLCDFVLDMYISNPTSIKPSLIKNTLKTLTTFLNWIPLGYVFETPLMMKIVTQLLPVPAYRTEAVKCITEVACLRGKAKLEAKWEEALLVLFINLVESMERVINGVDLYVEYQMLPQKTQTGYETFCQYFGLLLTSYLQNHLELMVDTVNNVAADPTAINILIGKVERGLEWLLQISYIPNDEVFKICAEFWNFLTSTIYTTVATELIQAHQLSAMFGKFCHTTSIELTMEDVASNKLFTMICQKILPKVVPNHIQRIPRPKEVLITTDENGNVAQEQYKDTEAITLYQTMKRTLVLLSTLDSHLVSSLLLKELDSVVMRTDKTLDSLNRLCWAIGAIHDSMSEEEERDFLVKVLDALLLFVDTSEGIDRKALIAANIMYVVGQYPNFLKENWKLLKVILNKLATFMNEKHPGVQDMACETYLKIAKECRKEFAKPRGIEEVSFVYKVVGDLSEITNELELHQAAKVYQAVGWMIQAVEDNLEKEMLLQLLMKNLCGPWENVLIKADENVDSLKTYDTIKVVELFVRINEAVAESVGPCFSSYMAKIYVPLLKIYEYYSVTINSQCETLGESAIENDTLIKLLRGIRKTILKLLESFIKYSNDPSVIAGTFAPHLAPVLNMYEKSIPAARDAEALALFALLADFLKELFEPMVEPVIRQLGIPTVSMISSYFLSFPEHRLNFFTLIQKVIQNCFTAVFDLPLDLARIVVDSMLYAMKHTDPKISEIGALAILTMVVQARRYPLPLLDPYFLGICSSTFTVLTDSLHKAGFKIQADILQNLLTMCMLGEVKTELVVGKNAKEAVKGELVDIVERCFPHIGKAAAEGYIQGLFANYEAWRGFKVALKDFLINLKEFAGDADLLFAEDQKTRTEKENGS